MQCIALYFWLSHTHAFSTQTDTPSHLHKQCVRHLTCTTDADHYLHPTARLQLRDCNRDQNHEHKRCHACYACLPA